MSEKEFADKVYHHCHVLKQCEGCPNDPDCLETPGDNEEEPDGTDDGDGYDPECGFG